MASFRSRNPIPVGAAFLAGLLVLFFLAFNFQNLPFTGARHYSAAFSEAAGLRPTDKVRVGGVAVGDVKGVKLEGNHVRVSFTITDHSVHLGRATSASIEIFTLLGNKYLALEPKGDGEWPSKQELPLTQTTSPYDVVPAFQDLSRNLGQIDTKQPVPDRWDLRPDTRGPAADLRERAAHQPVHARKVRNCAGKQK